MRRPLLTLVVIGAMEHGSMGQEAKLDGPPTILNLNSNMTDSSVKVTCIGKEPYSYLPCKVYRLSVNRISSEEYQRRRAELQKELATYGEAEFRSDKALWCSPAIAGGLEKDIANYSPGRAAEVRNKFKDKEAVCGCATTQCFASIRLEQQTHEQDECTFSSTEFSVDFVKVGDRKWVSNNGPEGICGVVSVFTIEHETNYTSLWTYVEQYIYTNNNADELCKLAQNQTSTYSWKAETQVRLRCEEVKFTTNPNFEELLTALRKISAVSEEKKP